MAPTKKPAGAKAVAAAPRKKKTNGYQMPVKIPNGEILTDVCKKQWKIGKSIGIGGFGEIYLAASADKSAAAGDYKFVVKIEPHANGPLFVESHFYKRVAKLDDIEKFRKHHGLKTFGMPNLIASGSHDLDNIKHRFIIIPRYGQNIWNIFLENNRRLPLHTVYRLAIQMIDVLQYIHSHTYVHMDIKGANILLGIDKSTTSQVYLVDFGLACHYTTKDFKPDPKKMHDGTIEYTSRDAHLGVPTMRGDFEVLAYNILHWSGGSLPWEMEKLLNDPKKVQASKESFMKSIDSSLRISLHGLPPADAIVKFFKMILELKYDQAPDYDKCRKILMDGLKTLGKTNAGEFDFKLDKNVGVAVATKPAKVATKTKAVRTKSSSKNKVAKIPSIEVSDEESDDDHPTVATKPAKVATKTKAVHIKSPSKNKVAKIPSIDVSDDENDDDDDDDYNQPGPSNRIQQQRPRKRPVQDNLSPDSSSSIPKKSKNRPAPQTTPPPPPATSKSQSSSKTVVISQPSAPGTLTVSSTPSKDGKKSNKTYQLNLELNVSIDANIVVNVRRNDKKEKKTKVTASTPTNQNDDDDIIPDSTENTPIARVRMSNKKGNGATPSRRSPRN